MRGRKSFDAYKSQIQQRAKPNKVIKEKQKSFDAYYSHI